MDYSRKILWWGDGDSTVEQESLRVSRDQTIVPEASYLWSLINEANKKRSL